MAEHGIITKELATIFKLADIAVGLDFTPSTNGIKADVEQIGFGTMRKTELGHGLTRRRRKVELLTDTLKNIALDNAAGIAFVARCAWMNMIRIRFQGDAEPDSKQLTRETHVAELDGKA